MPLDSLLQQTVAFLSVPLVGALLVWLAQRFTRERRLTLRLERLASIYSGLPEGETRREFGNRVNDVAAQLNCCLDPLFKRERRRKRMAAGMVFGVVLFMVYVYPGLEWASTGGRDWMPVVLAFVLVGAFLLIERDTRRQRVALAADAESR